MPVPPLTRVLLIDPDRATREATRQALIRAGVAQVVAVATVDEVDEQLLRRASGELAMIGPGLGSAASALIAALHAAGWVRTVSALPAAAVGQAAETMGASVSDRRSRAALRPLQAAANGLSRREVEIIQLVSYGWSNKRIGEQLGLSPLTVKTHLLRVGRKLGGNNRAGMAAQALRAGIIV